jgi:hypothetical protein
MFAATLVALTLQVFFGLYVGGVANYPATPVSIGSTGALLSAMSSAAGTAIFLHAFWGVLVVLMGIGTVVIARRYESGRVTVSSLAGVLSLLIALLGGLLFAASDFANGVGILLMVTGAIAAYVFLILAFFFSRRMPDPGRS